MSYLSYLCCVFVRLVYPMLQVSLDFPILIAPSVFSNVYLHSVLRFGISFRMTSQRYIQKFT